MKNTRSWFQYISQNLKHISCVTQNNSLYKPKTIINLFYLWANYLIKNTVRRRRFTALTPPLFMAQYLYDRRNRQLFKIKIRDGVDWTQMERIYLSNEYDLSKLPRNREVLQFYSSALESDHYPLIIDCGANMGLATRYFMQTYPGAKAVSIEPDAANMKLARINNSNFDVIFHEAAVSSEVGMALLIDMGSNNAFRVIRNKSGDLPCITINSIVDSCKRGIPFIIKIDIEGFESDLFSKNVEWIDKFPIILLELHDWLIPKSNISKNFLTEISKRDRDFIHYDGYIASIANNLEFMASSANPCPQP